MALPLHLSSTTWIFSIQVLFIFISAVSVAVLLSFYLPAMVEFAAIEVPATWECVAAWFRPPYLYAIINGIIITIVASSWFQNGVGDVSQEIVQSPAVAKADVELEFDPVLGRSGRDRGEFLEIGVDESSVVYGSHLDDDKASEVKAVVVSGFEADDEGEVAILTMANTDPVVVPKEHVSLTERISPAEKPLVFTRIGGRKSLKAGRDGGKARRVAKPKHHETLETTWKMITEGRPMPLMNKCDTWDRHARRVDPKPEDPSPDPKKVMKKSDTQRDRAYHPPARVPSVRLRKEFSPSQDELNRRVEAFINNFNEQMRLQRQESLEQYHDMIKR